MSIQEASETAVQHRNQDGAEEAGENGKSASTYEKSELTVHAVRVNQISKTLQDIRELIVERMQALRPGPHPSFRESDRHGELKRILNLADNGAEPGDLIFALRHARYKGTRSFGKRIALNDTDGSVALQQATTTEAELTREIIDRVDALLERLDPNDTPAFAPADTEADRAYGRAGIHLFEPPAEADDGDAPVKVA